jgi:CheY-like chemotaxis protein
LAKRILVVSHNEVLRRTRVALLQWAGYAVVHVESDDDALAAVRIAHPDLVLLGRITRPKHIEIDQRLREAYPDLPILKIVLPTDLNTQYASRVTAAAPREVLGALEEMFGEPAVRQY